jgi:hypothetical protein
MASQGYRSVVKDVVTVPVSSHTMCARVLTCMTP